MPPARHAVEVRRNLGDSGIGLQIRRQLEKHRSKLSRAAPKAQSCQKARNKIFRPFQALDVRNHLMRFNAETKMRRRFLNPILDRGLFHQLPKGKVYFDRIKLRGVVTAEIFSARAWRDKSQASSSDRPIQMCRQKVEPWQALKVASRSTTHSGRDYTLRLGLRADDAFAAFSRGARTNFLRFIFSLGGHRNWRRFLWCRSRDSLEIGQPLLQFEHRGEQVAQLLHACDNLPRFEHQQVRIFLLERIARTSSHFTGVETVGCSRARNEYTATVVLCSSFWLQSTRTFPVRTCFFMSETTSSGCSCSSNCASA